MDGTSAIAPIGGPNQGRVREVRRRHARQAVGVTIAAVIVLSTLAGLFVWDSLSVYEASTHTMGGLGYKINRPAFEEAGLLRRSNLLLAWDAVVVVAACVLFGLTALGTSRRARALCLASVALPLAGIAASSSGLLRLALLAVAHREAATYGSKAWSASEALWLARGHANVGAAATAVLATALLVRELQSHPREDRIEEVQTVTPRGRGLLLAAVTLLLASIDWVILERFEREVFRSLNQDVIADVAKDAAIVGTSITGLLVSSLALGVGALVAAARRREGPGTLAVLALAGIVLLGAAAHDRVVTHHMATLAAAPFARIPTSFLGELPRSTMKSPLLREYGGTVVRDRGWDSALPETTGESAAIYLDRRLLVRNLAPSLRPSASPPHLQLIVVPSESTAGSKLRLGSLAALVGDGLGERRVFLVDHLDRDRLVGPPRNLPRVIHLVHADARGGFGVSELWIQGSTITANRQHHLELGQRLATPPTQEDVVLVLPDDASVQALVDGLDRLADAGAGGRILATTQLRVEL